MSTYTEIGNQIETILKDNITNVNYIYNYVETNPEGYPSISIEAFDGNGQFLDTGRNRRNRMFRLICMQERIKVGASESERIMRALVDQVVATFDSRTNLTLNNSCEFATPIPSKWGYVQAPDIDIRSAEIILEAVSVE
jgi:hypothetical protein